MTRSRRTWGTETLRWLAASALLCASSANAQTTDELQAGVDAGTDLVPAEEPGQALSPTLSPAGGEGDKLFECIDPSELERLERVRASVAGKTAFQPTAVWLPPLFMTDAERSYYWAGLLYFQTSDFVAHSKTRLLPPLFVWNCTPQSKTLITPFYSSRTDAKGTASLFLTYFMRRDRLAESDVLFPFFWSLRERKHERDDFDEVNGGLLPLAFWGRHRSGDHYTVVAPLFFQWGNATESNLIAGPVYSMKDPQRWRAGIVPLWFSGGSAKGDSRFDVIPPLLFFHSEEGATSSTFVINTWYQHRAKGFTFNSVPFVFANREGEAHQLLLPLLLTYHRGEGTFEETWAANAYWRSSTTGWKFHLAPLLFLGRGEFDYTFVPPLFWRWREGETTTTIAGPVYYRSDPMQWDAGVVPFFFAAKGPIKHWWTIPLLLTVHVGEEIGDSESTWVANAYFHQDSEGWLFNLVPLVFAGASGARHHVFVPPLFWNWGDEKSDTTILFPGFLHTESESWTAGLVPLWLGGRNRERTWHFIPPLLTYHQTEGDLSTTWAVNTYFQQRPRGFTLASVPFLFAGRQDDRSYFMVPPLFWHWEDAGQDTTVVGTAWLHQEESGSDFGFAPLYFGGRYGPNEWDVVPPLFARWTREGRHGLLIAPLLTYHGGDGETETTWVAQTYFQQRRTGFTLSSVPFLFAWREGEKSQVVVPPLFWHWEDPRQSTTIVGTAWLHQSEAGSDFGLAPLYFGGRYGPNEWDAVPPFFARWSTEEHDDVLIPPLLTYFQVRKRGFTLTSVPFLFAYREGAKSRVMVPPLFWHWEDAGQDTTVVGPAWLHQQESGSDFGFAPLYFGGRYGPNEWDVVPPLFARWTREGRHGLLIAPLLTYHGGDGETETTWVAQTYFQQRKSGFTLTSVPFLFAWREGEKSHVVVPPLFWHWEDPQQSTTIVGTAWLHQSEAGSDFGLAPLYFGGRYGPTQWDATPLFARWNDEGKHHVLIPPLLTYHGGDGETETTWVAQTYFQQRKNGFTLHSVPFLFAGREGEKSHLMVPPLFWHWEDERQTTTVVGTAWLHLEEAGADFGLAPLYFGGRYGEREWDVVAPLFARWTDGTRHDFVAPLLLTYHGGDEATETETTWVAQTYFQERKNGYTLISLPFLYASQQGEERKVMVPPLFWHWADANESTTVVGTAWLHEQEAGADFGIVPLYFGGRYDETEWDVVPPLFARWTKEGRHHLLIPPLLTFHSEDAQQNTTVVGPGWFHQEATGFSIGLAPLYFGGRYPGSEWDVAPPLFARWLERGTHHLLIPPLLTYHEGDGATETTWVGNTYFQERKNGFTLASVPLLFAGREGDRNHLVVPPLFWHFHEGVKDSLVAGPFYRFADAKGVDTGLVPLWFSSEHGASRWDVVTPLFYRRSAPDSTQLVLFPLFGFSQTRSSTLLLSPLFVHSKSREEERTVVAGLFWRMKGPDTNTTVAFPFWWDVHSPKSGTRLSTVFPVYWRYEKPGEVTHAFLNLMYSYGVTPRGPSWSFHFFPFLDLASYNPQHFLWQIISGLLGHELQDEQHRWRVAWIWTEPRPLHPTPQQ